MQNRFPLTNDLFISFCSSYLSIQDILNLSLTSNAHHQFTSTPCLWKTLGTKDFYVAIQHDDTKSCYKEMKLGISREKERYINYMTALSLIYATVEAAPDYTALPKATQEYRKKNALKEQLENHVLESDAAFEKAYKELTAAVENNRLIEIKTNWNKLYTGFISTDVDSWFISLFNNSKNQDPIEYKKRTNELLFELAFLPLCRLDASLSLNILINKQACLKQNDYILFAFNYPCIKSISHLLNTKIELNEKNWVINGAVRMHITPIMFAAIGMSEGKQVNTYKEMISLLLQHDADTQLSVFITDDDWKTDEEYDQRSKPINEWCQLLLEAKMDNFKNEHDKNTFKESMLMIINHKPEKDANLSERRINIRR